MQVGLSRLGGTVQDVDLGGHASESRDDALARIHGELGRLLGGEDKDESDRNVNPALDELSELREVSQADTSLYILWEDFMKPDLGATQWWIFVGWLCQVVHGGITMGAFGYEVPRKEPINNVTVVEVNNTYIGLPGNATVNVTQTTEIGATYEPVALNPFLYVGVLVWFGAALQAWYVSQAWSFSNRRSPLWHQRYLAWPRLAMLFFSLAQAVTVLTLLLFQKGIGVVEALPKALSNTEIYCLGILVLFPLVIASLAHTMTSAHLLGALNPQADAARTEIRAEHAAEEEDAADADTACCVECCSASLESLPTLAVLVFLLELTIFGTIVVSFWFTSEKGRWKFAWLFLAVCATYTLASQGRYNSDLLVQQRRRPKSAHWHRRHMLYPLHLMQVWGMIGWAGAVALVCHNQDIQLWEKDGSYLAAFAALDGTRLRFLAATTTIWAVAVPILYRIASHHMAVATMPGLLSVNSPASVAAASPKAVASPDTIRENGDLEEQST